MSNPRLNASFRSLPLIDAQYTDVTGFEPGIATMRFAVGDPKDIPKNGDLKIGDGNSSITRRRCRSLEVSIEQNKEDINATLTATDRRWRLPYLGTVSGTFNRRDDSGAVVGATKTARELAEMCLKALGESRYDAVGMPQDEKPFVAWDHTPAKRALESLVDLYGVMFVLTGNDTVRLVKRGEGDASVHGFKTGDAARIPITIRPRTIEVYTGRSHCQISSIKLAPIAVDKGKLKPLKEVSYNPENRGFEFAWNWGKFAREIKKLSEDSIRWERYAYKWFRLPKTISIDGEAVALDDAFLRLLPDIVDEIEIDFGDGKPIKVREKMYISGQHVTERSLSDPTQLATAKKTDRVQVPFRIDTKMGVVIFKQPVMWIENGVTKAPALELTAAFLGKLDNPDRRHKYTYPLGQTTIADLTLTVRAFDTRLEKIDGKARNAAAVKVAAQAAIENAKRERNITETARTETHGKIVPADLTGKREQVSYSVGAGGPETVVSIGYEHSLIQPPKEAKQARRRVQAATLEIEEAIDTGYLGNGEYANEE